MPGIVRRGSPGWPSNKTGLLCLKLLHCDSSRKGIIVGGVKVTVRPTMDPVSLASRTLRGLESGDVVWERQRAAMPVIAVALRLVCEQRPDVRASKLEGSGEVLVCLSVDEDWSGVGYATGRKVTDGAA